MNNHDGAQVVNEWLFSHGHSFSKAQSRTSPTYRSWLSMRQRCVNEKSHNYGRYGGRGIVICSDWLESFPSFLKDMGERPKNHTLDRIDPDGNYCKDNCRWAPTRVQALNKSGSIYATEGLDLPKLSEDYGIPLTTIYRRYKQGYRGQDLISKENKNKLRFGEKCANSKLTISDVELIIKMLESGISQRKISEKFMVSQPVISEIKTGKHRLVQIVRP